MRFPFKSNSSARRSRCWAVLTVLVALAASRVGYGAEILSPDLVAGQKLYKSRCAKCHKMHDPSKYSAQQWDTWMEKMGKKARLKPAQKEAVAQYVESNLRQTARQGERKSAPTAQR